MVNHLHVLVLGFDAQRLVKPLSSGTFSPDRVLLLRDEHDKSDGRTSSPHEELLADAYDAVNGDLQHYLDVEVDERYMPLASDFVEVFCAFHDFFEREADQQRITVNLSAAPKSTALALEAARATWISEHPEHAETIQLYYFKPRRYLETEVRQQLNSMVSHVDDLARERHSFQSDVQGDLLNAVTQPVSDALHRVKNKRDAVDRYIDDAVDATESDEEGSSGRFGKITDAVDEVASTVDDIVNDEDEPSEELTELETFLSKAEDLCMNIEEDPRRTVEAFRTEYNRRITEHGVPDRIADPLFDAIEDLDERVKTMVNTRETLKSQLDAFHQEVTHVEQAANRAETVLDEISRAGMTEGIRGEPSDWQIPLPPTADLRGVETVILYVLERRGDQRSVQALARSTAEELRILAEEIGAHPEAVEMETAIKNCCIRMASEDRLGDDVEEFFVDRLRNRLQYNLQSLENKGYVRRREAEDDSRRVETELSDTGKLWTSIRELSEIRRTAVQEELRDQLEEFVE